MKIKIFSLLTLEQVMNFERKSLYLAYIEVAKANDETKQLSN
jgi:hypothetical protein